MLMKQQFNIENSLFRSKLFPEKYFEQKAIFKQLKGLNDHEPFAWNHVKGYLFESYAPLPAKHWNQNAINKFASWRCAIFPPDNIDPNKPIVLAFTGIGGDFSDTGWIVPHVTQGMKTIFVAFETHMTGTRNLLAPYENIGKNVMQLDKYDAHNGFSSDLFIEIVQELSFNTHQITELVKQVFNLEDIKFVTTGFSLGAYYSAQLAFSHPNCLGFSIGGGSPFISDYYSLLRKLASPLSSLLRKIPNMPWYECILRTKYDAYDYLNAPDNQSYILNYGKKDILCKPSKKITQFKTNIKNKSKNTIINNLENCNHDPGPINKLWETKFPHIGKKMIEGLYEIVG